jgi:uroporphyrinogen decarboxylase
VKEILLAEPTLKGYQLPEPLDKRFFEDLPDKIDRYGDRFRLFAIGFFFV